MRYITDLHIHSKYSRACSKDLDLEHIYQWCRVKGIDIVGTADFTHPAWFKELKDKLIEDRPGLFKLRQTDGKTLFLLSTELSCIYKQGDKTRRLHICVFVPSLETVGKINKALTDRGVNISSDGRPIMGLSAKELAEIILEIDQRAMIIPAHAWTPWFSVFGSNSGFDSLVECFGETAKYIHAIETGLSSDPAMNWQWSALDNITLISNSDAHSPANLGREANVFEIDPKNLSYDEIYKIIQTKDKKKFLYTIEFFPEEGKYHGDGHRDCGVSLTPEQTVKNKGICPICRKSLTVGVLNRVNQLADRKPGFKLDSISYKNVVPLAEILAEYFSQGKNTKKVMAAYNEMITRGGSEFKILLDLSVAELNQITEPEIALGIKNIRAGRVEVAAGYDGVYGSVRVFSPNHIKLAKQKKLL